MLQKTVVDEMELGYWGLLFMSFDSTFQARSIAITSASQWSCNLCLVFS